MFDNTTEHAALRDAVADARAHLDRTLPEGREKSTALTRLQEAHHWAAAALSH